MTTGIATSTSSEDDASLRKPTPAELTDGVARLLVEVDGILSSDRWAILNTGSAHALWLLHDAASLRHCCRLLQEIDVAAQAGRELTVLVLCRTHLEAFLIGLYIHFGGHEALLRIAQDTRHQFDGLHEESQKIEQSLTARKASAEERVERIKSINRGITFQNAKDPAQPPRPLLEEPYIPQLLLRSLDLTEQIDALSSHQAQNLPVSEVVDTLTKIAPEKNFGRESFRPMYLIYRLLSTIGTHPTLPVYSAYFTPGGFTRTTATPAGDFAFDAVWITTLNATAFLASRVLGDAGCATPVADELFARTEPDPSGGAGWMSDL